MNLPYTPPKRRSQRNRAVVVGSLLAVAVSAVLMWLVVDFASREPEQVQLPGGETFVVGDAKRLARRVAGQGAPILFKDPLSAGPGREIYLLHGGGREDEGWSALLAYAPGAPREVRCILRWDRSTARFTDPCGGTTYSPEDQRLTRYEADVNDDGKVEVDLRRLRTASGRPTS